LRQAYDYWQDQPDSCLWSFRRGPKPRPPLWPLGKGQKARSTAEPRKTEHTTPGSPGRRFFMFLWQKVHVSSTKKSRIQRPCKQKHPAQDSECIQVSPQPPASRDKASLHSSRNKVSLHPPSGPTKQKEDTRINKIRRPLPFQSEIMGKSIVSCRTMSQPRYRARHNQLRPSLTSGPAFLTSHFQGECYSARTNTPLRKKCATTPPENSVG